MILSSNFKFIIRNAAFKELVGIMAYKPCGDKMQLAEILPPGALISTDETIGFLKFNLLFHESLIELVKATFRTDVVYWFKSNSLNFNMSELPFQTYSAFITNRDAYSIYKEQFVNMTNEMFSEHLNHFYNSSRGIGTENEIIIYRALRAIVANNLNYVKFYATLTETMNLDIEEQSRFWNQLLIIGTTVFQNETKSDLLKSWLDALDANEKLRNIKRL